MDTVIIPRQRHLANVIRDIIMCDQCGILARVRQIDHGWHWSRCWSLCLLRIGYLKCLTPLSILGPSPPGPITPSVGNDLTNQKPHLRHRKHGEQKFGWSMNFGHFFYFSDVICLAFSFIMSNVLAMVGRMCCDALGTISASSKWILFLRHSWSYDSWRSKNRCAADARFPASIYQTKLEGSFHTSLCLLYR